jgi:hypothetical protein
MQNIWVILPILVMVFTGCPVVTGATTGTFVVQNQSHDPTIEITDVWAKTKGSIDWVNYWHGSCAGDAGLITELSFPAEPGAYDIRIRVSRYGFLMGFYETGYLQSLKIEKGGHKFIIYDGNGIYDMESQ